ncbi:hypothetical protein EXIGLDRAFT_758617 [Exidia glandulosa HHB12029]|uniref:F-box domain-containing protein n=1 Tax=Exidia glandulosa HHB12029 TaxID=1314781 RepID=A0A165R0I7_EXIGL|nr:hypothetical protein EXIGLDRAFT_758617 [Exidia glandulosa HHB12029]
MTAPTVIAGSQHAHEGPLLPVEVVEDIVRNCISDVDAQDAGHLRLVCRKFNDLALQMRPGPRRPLFFATIRICEPEHQHFTTATHGDLVGRAVRRFSQLRRPILFRVHIALARVAHRSEALHVLFRFVVENMDRIFDLAIVCPSYVLDSSSVLERALVETAAPKLLTEIVSASASPDMVRALCRRASSKLRSFSLWTSQFPTVPSQTQTQFTGVAYASIACGRLLIRQQVRTACTVFPALSELHVFLSLAHGASNQVSAVPGRFVLPTTITRFVARIQCDKDFNALSLALDVSNVAFVVYQCYSIINFISSADVIDFLVAFNGLSISVDESRSSGQSVGVSARISSLTEHRRRQYSVRSHPCLDAILWVEHVLLACLPFAVRISVTAGPYMASVLMNSAHLARLEVVVIRVPDAVSQHPSMVELNLPSLRHIWVVSACAYRVKAPPMLPDALRRMFRKSVCCSLAFEAVDVDHQDRILIQNAIPTVRFG